MRNTGGIIREENGRTALPAGGRNVGLSALRPTPLSLIKGRAACHFT